ncbi:glycosyltransferase [Selenomonas ruminantium]|uniref:Glycosyltransferase involved in cell wall bisynthesis n=1 Tax=Selenomonas ruminantium TaxID=971 RepID=A0A1H0S2L5_SELRU|nr:glycosyltransferase [Selenomonas ruminantium]SDP35887.1 Glycosyltransferase involved in cell wall bisynthesis [Selenomonas ruminantium]
MSDTNITVSVILTTYNQEKYIGKAVESILAQKVDFPIEILIGEDCSTDGTAEVLRGYEKKYPGKFRIFYREKNLGANRNTYELDLCAKGKYIAGLEGDDYWSDPYKLQKQVDFLESHPEYYTCAHAFIYVDENGDFIDESDISAFDKRFWYGFNGEFTVQDFMQNKLPAQGGTWVYHNFFLEDKDTSIIYKADPFVGDWTYLLLLLSHGRFFVMTDKMSCYRRNMHGKGDSWNSSQGSNQFHFYDSFIYQVNLERYAREVLNIPLDLRVSKTPLFYYMVNYLFQMPSLGRWNCVMKMLKRTPEKFYYFKLLIKSMYLSTIYPSIRNTDPPRPDESIYNKLNKTWDDFYKAADGKEIVIYGAGGGARDILNQYYDRFKAKYIVDRNERKKGKYIFGRRICSLDSLADEDPNKIVILISTGMYYREIVPTLEKMGFNDYYVYQLMEIKKWRYKFLFWFDSKDRIIL